MTQPAPLSIKVRRNEELRRFTFDGPAFTYAALANQVRTIFALQPAVAVVLKYRDNEDDLVTVSSDVELAEAVRICAGNGNLLRLELTTPAAAKPAVAPAKTVAAPKAAPAPAPKPAPATPPAPAPTAAATSAALPVIASAETPGGTAAPSPAVAAPTAATATASASPTATAAQVAVPVVESKQAKQAALVAERQRKLAERERLVKEKAALQAEKARKKEEERKEALRKSMQEANEKGTTDAPHVHVQLLTAELERVKSELKAAKEEKKANEPPCGKALMWGRFVRDVSVPDGSVLQPNEPFVKTWRFRNELDRPWPLGTRLLFVGKNSDRLGAPDEVLISPPQLKPNEEIDISVPMVAPNAPGRYTGYFRLAGPEGKKFGQRVWVMISVAGTGSDEEENEPQPSAEQLALWRTQLDVLAQLHFTNNAANIRLLRRFNGSLEEVVATLMKRKAKRLRIAQHEKAIAVASAAVAPTVQQAPQDVTPAPVPISTPLPPIASASLSAGPTNANLVVAGKPTASAQVDH